MRKLILTLLAVAPLFAAAQTIADFESPILSKADTFYLPLDSVKTDNGFDNGSAHFPLHTTKFGSSLYWGDGFAISNYNDSVHGSFQYQYASRAGKGVHGSNQYVVVHFNSGYGDSTRIIVKAGSMFRYVQGFYATNSTYGYYTMKNGDGFVARKFGDTLHTHSGLQPGTYPDFLRLIIQGYRFGTLQPDTVTFYLADYRSSDSAKDYIVKDWRWVSLTKLGNVDSLKLKLEGSDTGAYGMNDPTYFCMDDFTTAIREAVNPLTAFVAKVYPNPTRNILFIEALPGATLRDITLFDVTGKAVLRKAVASVAEQINIEVLPAGNYTLRIERTDGRTATTTITKQ